MTENVFDTPAADDADAGGERSRRRTMMIGGGVAAAVLVLGVGGYSLLAGGNSSDASSAAVVVPHHVARTATAVPSASASAEQVLPVYHGDVGNRDPFAVPAALSAAQGGSVSNSSGVSATGSTAASGSTTSATATSPSVSAAPAASALPATTAAGVETPTVGLTFPGTGTSAASAAPTATGTPTSGSSGGSQASGSASSASGASVAGDQYLQLLRVHHLAGGYTVDVRTAAGVFLGVKPGTANVGKTLFFYVGDDETTGVPSFVFRLGESQGGNLTPHLTEDPHNPHADQHTLVLHNGIVDGGIYAQ